MVSNDLIPQCGVVSFIRNKNLYFLKRYINQYSNPSNSLKNLHNFNENLVHYRNDKRWYSVSELIKTNNKMQSLALSGRERWVGGSYYRFVNPSWVEGFVNQNHEFLSQLLSNKEVLERVSAVLKEVEAPDPERALNNGCYRFASLYTADDHNRFISTLEESGALKSKLTPYKLERLAEYLVSLPKASMQKLWSAIGTNQENTIALHNLKVHNKNVTEIICNTLMGV